MVVTFRMLVGLLMLGACVTSPRAYDPEQPALAWDAECQPENLQGMSRWVILTCTLTNRSQQNLSFRAMERVTSEKDAWRQPDTAELEVLKRDLRTRKNSQSLPLMLQGSDRLEGFIAQALVVSGLWLTRSAEDPVTLPGKTEAAIDVKPGASVRQAFVLYKEALTPPAFVTLKSADKRFQKQVKVKPDARQRVPVPE